MGFPDFGFWTRSDHKLINTLELKGVILAPHHCFSFTRSPTYDSYRQHYSCSLYSHTLLYLAVDLFLWQQTQDVAIRARSKRDRSSEPPISAEPAHNNRVKTAPRNSEPDLRDVGNSNTGHACLPQSTTRIFPILLSPIPEP